MKKYFLLSIFIFYSFIIHAQTKEDCIDFIKTNIESNSPLGNYKNNIRFSNDISKSDADRFTGKYLTTNEYTNLLIINEDVYTDSYKSKLYFQVFRICDLSKVSKVSINKVSNPKGADYYEIHIYVTYGSLCTTYYIPEIKEPESRKEISIGVKVDENIAKKIKKAIITLAKFCGSTSVIDGDDMF